MRACRSNAAVLARHLLIVSRGLICVGPGGTSARNLTAVPPWMQPGLRPHSYRSVSPGALPTFLMALCTCPCRAVGWQHMIDSHALLGPRSRFFAHVAALARCKVGQSDPGAWKCAL